MVLTKGEFYNKLKEQSDYSEATEKCIENTGSKLTNFTTTSERGLIEEDLKLRRH